MSPFLNKNSLRRAKETLAFSNWPMILPQILLTQIGKGPDEVTFVTRDGLRITCPNRRAARSSAFETFAEDGYRLAWFLKPFVGRPMHAIDIGGHVGAFACQLAQMYPEATIESYEASPVTAEYLRDNVVQNGYGDRVNVAQVALADRSGWVLLEDNGEGSCENSLVSEQGGEPNATTIKVPALSFDDVVSAAPHPVDFVKIDCEGAEYDLIFASSPASWKSVDRVVLEYHPVSGHSWSELSQWFTESGFELVEHLANSVQDESGLAWLARPIPNGPGGSESA
ncbi:MAG TPA: FkbM family methyltransferase [Acidimicrobiales bacterium]|nr:FkbM family methyltransferase [Acidimicrobiales bacterium]